jgi:DNA-binding NarL/FixJ family response regulator
MTVMVLTRTHDPARHARAIEAGADGVLTKDSGADEVLNTARRITEA